MSTEENKALSARIFAALSRGDIAGATESYTAETRIYGFAPQPLNLESYKQVLAMYFSAFPDIRLTVEDMVAEGDKVAARYIARGTHRGEFMGIPPTGRQIETSEMMIAHVVNGKTVMLWVCPDNLTMFQQLGAIEAPGQASAAR